MYEHNVVSSKSLDCKNSHDCNLDIVVEPLITTKACINDSEVDEVDGSELEIGILSNPLESKVIFGPTLVSLLPREEKLIVCELDDKRHEIETKTLEIN